MRLLFSSAAYDSPSRLTSNSLYTAFQPEYRPGWEVHDIRARLDLNESVTVVFELTGDAKALCSGYRTLSLAVVHMLDKSQVIFHGEYAASVMIFRVSERLVCKVTGTHDLAANEHQTLAYLRDTMPAFPSPRPYGLLRQAAYSFLFMTYMGGQTLENLWPIMDLQQKNDMSVQLDRYVGQLRSLEFPAGRPMGDVYDGVCRDLRRGQRVSQEPIWTVQEFENFVFSSPSRSEPLCLQALQDLLPNRRHRVVFTHGDLRPGNILVKPGYHGNWVVTGILDWETSGFYPEYWEAIKATDNLAVLHEYTWFKLLPKPIAPRTYAREWLVDRILDDHVIHGSTRTTLELEDEWQFEDDLHQIFERYQEEIENKIKEREDRRIEEEREEWEGCTGRSNGSASGQASMDGIEEDFIEGKGKGKEVARS